MYYLYRYTSGGNVAGYWGSSSMTNPVFTPTYSPVVNQKAATDTGVSF